VGLDSNPRGETIPPTQGNSPLHQLLTRQLQVPSFSNEKRDWDDFVWKFEDFLSKMDGGRVLAEKTKLQALEMAMPSPIQNEIRLLKLQMDHNLVFNEMMQKLERRFGEGRSIGKRQKWKEISLTHAGKIQMAQFKDFETKFRLGEIDVKDATPHESYRTLMEKLPPFMVNWVVEEEEKMRQKRPTVALSGLPGLGVQGISRNIEHWIGVPPREITPIAGDAFLVRFEDVSHMTKMLKFNGRQTSAGGHKISVRETDLHLPTEGIFRLIEAKLLLREKSEAFQNGKESGGSSQNRSSRGEVKGKKGFSANSSPSPVHAVGAGARGTSDSGSLGGVPPAGGGPKAPPSPRTSGASPTTATKPPVEPTRAAGRATEPETAWPEEAQPESWGKGGGAKGKGPSSYYPPSQPWWTSKGSGAKGKGKGAPPVFWLAVPKFPIPRGE